MTWLWFKLKGYILGAGAVMALVLGIYLKGRTDQKSVTEAKQNKKRLDDVERAKEIDNDIRKSSESDLDAELSKWMRD